MTIDAIRSDLALLDDWEDRYRYLIELGRTLPSFPEDQRTEDNKVQGCASQVWLVTNLRRDTSGEPSVLELQGDSDAHIVKGLVAVVFAIFEGKTPSDIIRIDAKSAFAELGLQQHLTPQRSNGFHSMVERILRDARASAG
ncbi:MULTISPECIES: SufE family protein [unclassified Hyphomicrobium]|uniref:SufE family protein n=1 Tax=unclassified Hyphomicrobium TaxID=2619925 RepID=UPI000213D63B|nr:MULTISPECIES: SufE family protein [unclassified Hyphomicrobium]CCB66898.1 Uncharacterized sufE-like protein R01000 [Hyphomicrobium sp. MC1]